MKKIIIVGSLPPPIGGVTIHILRLIENLANKNTPFIFFDLRQKRNGRFNIWIYFINFISVLVCGKGNIIHYQLNNWLEATLLSICCKMIGKKMVYTVHSFAFNIKKLGIFKKIAIYISKKSIDKFIAPSETIKKKMIQNDFSEDKIVVLDTFLPPSEKELSENVPTEIKEYVSTTEKIILANASNLYLNENKVDVYGLDMCIQACAKIPSVKFLYCIPTITNHKYYQKCLSEIKRLGIENRFLVYNNDVSLVSMFKYCDLFVRPTVSDSFGISIAEALICNVPAIASNVCERAEGTILFESRNVDNFILKIVECLESKKEYHYDEKILISDYLRVYKELG